MWSKGGPRLLTSERREKGVRMGDYFRRGVRWGMAIRLFLFCFLGDDEMRCGSWVLPFLRDGRDAEMNERGMK